ncbi:squalene synthase HpnC [Acetobacter sp. AN02]|uniref:squalene synthase HpnC n=1 Tax=Acetobacter sp. AN02 TaxID=2894186 RepID=UPI0024341BF7|nr:squalene synthase HpnC [Acetobacter sp. AN02]MDG6094002.1 squalene synthase HpnC [Acetobacter sp. AN02]
MRDDPWGREDVSTGKGEGDENFPVGSVLFTRRLRADVSAYYDFARASDDISDSERLTPDAKVARLDAMEAVLRGALEAPAGRADARSAVRLRESFLRSGMPFEVATDLLIAFRQDARKVRYDSWDDLLGYCRNSANPVGRFLLILHGEDARSFGPSDALCTSLQILNHIQDCRGDLERLDRCYVPLDMLKAHGASVDDLRGSAETAGLRRVFSDMLDRVDDLNREASALVPLVRDRRMRMYCGAVVRLAHLLAARLRRGDPVAGRVSLSRADFVRGFVSALRAAVRGV